MSWEVQAALPSRHVDALQCLFTQWFPISYPDVFYNALRGGPYLGHRLPALTPFIEDPSGELVASAVAQPMEAAKCRASEETQVLTSDTATDESHLCLYLMALGVRDDHRRKGLAKQLIQYLLDFADADDRFQAILLHVLWSNTAALALYKSMGFTVIRRIDEYYDLPSGREACFVVARPLHGATLLPGLQLEAVHPPPDKRRRRLRYILFGVVAVAAALSGRRRLLTRL